MLLERRGDRRAGVRRAAAAGRRAPAGPGHLRQRRRSRPRPDDRAVTGGPHDRDARAGRPPRPGPRRRQRRRLRRPARPRPRPPRRAAGRRASSDADHHRGGARAPTPGPTIRAGHAGQQRAHVREGASSGADLVFLDLEDACAPVAKEGARAIAVDALTGHDWGRTVRAVRVNGIDTPWCHDDIIEIVTGAGDALDVIIVPKARTARDVWWVDVLLTQLETKLGLDAAHRPGGAHRGGRRPGQRGRRSPRPATGWRRSSSAPATCRRRCTPASTATSIR